MHHGISYSSFLSTSLRMGLSTSLRMMVSLDDESWLVDSNFLLSKSVNVTDELRDELDKYDKPDS